MPSGDGEAARNLTFDRQVNSSIPSAIFNLHSHVLCMRLSVNICV